MASRRGEAGLRTALVTVGTTKFEELIKAVDSEELASTLANKGYTELVIQKGAGAYYPRQLLPDGQQERTLPSGLKIRCFDFVPNLGDAIKKAALVISHAGSGSIFESLSAGCPLIVVPNPLLMDNHQVELAEQLAAMKHLVSE